MRGSTTPSFIAARKGWSDAYDCAKLAVEGIAKVADLGGALNRMFGDKGIPNAGAVAEEARLQRWFGALGDAAVAKVEADLKKMWDAFQHKRVIIVNREDIQIHLVNGDDPFGETTPSFTGGNVYGFVWTQTAGSGYRVIMGKHFLADPDPIESAAQTTYHELTHKVLATKDHCYGKIKSRGLATFAQDKALANADNFGFYAVSFIKTI